MKMLIKMIGLHALLFYPIASPSQHMGLLRPHSREICPLPHSASIASTIESLHLQSNAIDTLGPYPGDYNYLVGGWSQDVFFEWFASEATCTVKEIWIYFYRCGYHNSGALQLYKTEFPEGIPDDAIDGSGWIGYYGTGQESCGTTSSDGSWKGSSWAYDPLKTLIWGGAAGVPVTIPNDNYWLKVELADFEAEPVITAGERFAVVYTVAGRDWSPQGRQDILATMDDDPPYPGLKFYDNTDANPNGGPAGDWGWHIRSYTWLMYAVVEYAENSPPAIAPTLPVYTVIDASAKALTCTIQDYDAADSARAGVASATVHFRLNDGTYNSKEMLRYSGTATDGYWRADLPNGYIQPGETLYFHFSATDKAGLTATSEEHSFSCFQKQYKLLAFFNDISQYSDSQQSLYFSASAHLYDVWNGVTDGPLTHELVAPYNDIVQLDGFTPATLNDDVIGAWLAGGSRHLFWSSQEWGYCLNGGRDSLFADDDWHATYLGIQRIGPQDINISGIESQMDPFRIMPDSTDFFSRPIAAFLGDSLWLYYHPYYELDFPNFIDAFSLADAGTASACFFDGTGNKIVGVHNEFAGNKTVFLTFDQLALDTAYPDITPNYEEPAGTCRVETDVYSLLDAALNWFGTPVSIESNPEPTVVTHFQLDQNYPNPFKEITRIGYHIDESGRVRLTVYNIMGQKVFESMHAASPAGHHEISLDGRAWNSGIYFYQIQCGSLTKTNKMILLNSRD